MVKYNKMMKLSMYVKVNIFILLLRNDTDIDGKFQHLELSKYAEEDDIIYILLNDNTQYNIGFSYIKKIIR